MGADAFSFGAGIVLQSGDLMSIQWDGMGKALINPLKLDAIDETPIHIASL